MADRIVKVSPKPGKMEDIKPYSVAFVRRGANKREFLVTKNQDNKAMDDFEELLSVVGEIEADNEAELAKALEDAGVSEKGIEVAKTVARLQDAYSDELGPEVLAKALGIEIESDEDDDSDTINKSDIDRIEDPELREKVQANLEKNQNLESRVEKFEERAALSGWIDRAEELDGLNKSADELGEMLRETEKNAGEEAAEDLLETLTSASETAKTATDVFAEHGSSRPGSTSDAETELEKRAEELVEKGDYESVAKAQTHLLDTDPELRREYMSARS